MRKRREFIRVPRYETHVSEQLIRAASKGDIIQLQNLLNAGEDPNPMARDGLLFWAIRSRCPKCVDALVKAGARITKKELDFAQRLRLWNILEILQGNTQEHRQEHSPPEQRLSA